MSISKAINKKVFDLDKQRFNTVLRFFLLLQDKSRHDFVQRYVKELTTTAIHTEQKESVLQRLWPQILNDMVRSAVIDMYDTQGYAKKALEELEKS